MNLDYAEAMDICAKATSFRGLIMAAMMMPTTTNADYEVLRRAFPGIAEEYDTAVLDDPETKQLMAEAEALEAFGQEMFTAIRGTEPRERGER